VTENVPLISIGGSPAICPVHAPAIDPWKMLGGRVVSAAVVEAVVLVVVVVAATVVVVVVTLVVYFGLVV
jgi:hypothetical protein